MQPSSKNPISLELETPAAAPSPRLKRAPGPRSYPLVGNALQVQRNPLVYFTGLARQYGDIVGLRMLNQPCFLITHPDYVKRVFQENNRNYDRNDFTYQMLTAVMGNGVGTSDGPVWMRQRRLMQPAFHHRQIVTFGTQMVAATTAMLRTWQERRDPEHILDISSEMHRLTMSIVGQTLFSLDLGDDGLVASQAFATVFKMITDYLYLPFPPLSVPTPRNLRLKKAVRTLDQLVYDLITERRLHANEQKDLLSLLLEARDEETGEGMSDQQVRDEIMTLLLAGHETIANTLNWVWYLLSQNLDAEQRMHAELDQVLVGQAPTVERLSELPYTHMVIEESMRLYPAAWAIPRHVVAEDVMGDYSIPANSLVWTSAYITHRHPDFWEQPEVFDPERFTPERSAGRARYAYFPFGGGPHLCIGNSFAMMEARLLVATIGQRYRLRLQPGYQVVPKVSVTLEPAGGLPMTLQER